MTLCQWLIAGQLKRDLFFKVYINLFSKIYHVDCSCFNLLDILSNYLLEPLWMPAFIILSLSWETACSILAVDAMNVFMHFLRIFSLLTLIFSYRCVAFQGNRFASPLSWYRWTTPIDISCIVITLPDKVSCNDSSMFVAHGTFISIRYQINTTYL